MTMVEEHGWDSATASQRVAWLDLISESGRLYYKHYPAEYRWSRLPEDLQVELMDVPAGGGAGWLTWLIAHRAREVVLVVFGTLAAISAVGTVLQLVISGGGAVK